MQRFCAVRLVSGGFLEPLASVFASEPQTVCGPVACTERPRGHHEWYNSDTDQAEMAQTLDAAFGWAAARGCDAVVLPPIGCDSHGCSHPPLGVAALIREAVSASETRRDAPSALHAGVGEEGERGLREVGCALGGVRTLGL